MKKTLLICIHYPLPEKVGGNIRTMNFVRFFEKLGTVDVAYTHLLPGAEVERGAFAGEYFLERKGGGHSLIERAARWLAIKKRPFEIPQFDESSEKTLLRLIQAKDYDYILVRYIKYTYALFRLSQQHRARVIIDFDDILSGSLYEFNTGISDMNFLRRIGLKLNRRFLVDYERRCLGFGGALFCSEKDKAEITGMNNNGRAFVVPNVYANASFSSYNFGDGFSNSHDLLFVGALMYEPNVEGIRWFINSVFRGFRRQYPSARLMVVGCSPLPEVRALCESMPGVELFEDVPDLKEYYRCCRAVVVPLMAGGGTRLKILEAALAGRPILSTPIGSEGLSLRDGEEILLFRDEQEFIDRYDMLQRQDFYDTLIQKARLHVNSAHSFHNFTECMQTVLESLDGISHGEPPQFHGHLRAKRHLKGSPT